MVEHSFETRPWGFVARAGRVDGYTVKGLEVKPHRRLSYQTHTYRAELWIVVTGTATCVVEGRTVVAHAGDVVEIGVGVAHRITNMHDEELVIVEVQRGPYTGEDDILRLEDDYGRVDQLA